jgi:hypothetical protein
VCKIAHLGGLSANSLTTLIFDADAALDALQKSGKGKFETVFSEQHGFDVSSKRFLPYVEELALQIAKLSEGSENEAKAALPTIVKKMELLLSTLEQFKKTL